MLGDQAHLFDRGWKSERMGLGIGAAAYYRRIVEIRWEALVKSLLEEKSLVLEEVLAFLKQVKKE